MSSLNVKYEIKDTFEKRCWLPRSCFLTGKKLFMIKCTRVKTELTAGDKDIEHVFWVDSHSYLLFTIKGEL